MRAYLRIKDNFYHGRIQYVDSQRGDKNRKTSDIGMSASIINFVHSHILFYPGDGPGTNNWQSGLGWRAKDKFIVKKKDQETSSYAIMSTNTTSYKTSSSCDRSVSCNVIV